MNASTIRNIEINDNPAFPVHKLEPECLTGELDNDSKERLKVLQAPKSFEDFSPVKFQEFLGDSLR